MDSPTFDEIERVRVYDAKLAAEKADKDRAEQHAAGEAARIAIRDAVVGRKVVDIEGHPLNYGMPEWHDIAVLLDDGSRLVVEYDHDYGGSGWFGVRVRSAKG